MDELFAAAEGLNRSSAPLADRMRPQSLDEIVGQDHIVGSGRLLRRSIQADRLSSVLFYGPPGSGKTSLARVIAKSTKAQFESFNAVLTGVKEVREAITRADERRRLYGRRTILFVDEVHRWNKAQQDALLPWVENGTVILIGATTENPFFEVNKALVSRSRVFHLTSLSQANLMMAARRAISDIERGYGKYRVEFETGALEHLVDVANGDARSLLNAVELAVESSVERWPPPEGSRIYIDLHAAEESIQRKALLYDRDGDYHFDTISAFIKSLRGSDPDAALYWLAKMVRAGEDPSYIFRRMLVSASEDIGLADPNAIVVVSSCAAAFDRLGFPEGNFPLAEAALYLATAPKSNTALAFFDAAKEVEKEDAAVPNHLRDSSRDAEAFGHGAGYIYPHAYRDHWAAQQYLPKALSGKTFYNPSIMGYEGRLRDEILRKREIQLAVILDEDSSEAEVLSYRALNGRDEWLRRLDSSRGALFLADRDAIFAASTLARHHRLLIAGADDGLLLWEAVRRVPEGLVLGLTRSEAAKSKLERYAATLDELERPLLSVIDSDDDIGLPKPKTAEALSGTSVFDRLLARGSWKRVPSDRTAFFTALAERADELLAADGAAIVLLFPPALGERLSRVLERESGAPWKGLGRLKEAEEAFFSGATPTGEGALNAMASGLAWTAEEYAAAFRKRGFSCVLTERRNEDKRLVSAAELERWFDTEKSAWGKAIASSLGSEAFANLHDILFSIISRGPISWISHGVLLEAKKPL